MTTERLQFEIQGNTRVLERIEQSVRRIEQAVNRMAPRATKQLQNFNRAAERTSQTQQRAATATKTAAQAQRTANQSTRQGKTALDLYNTANQDLVKSVQLALGPLSGVAARLTALGALFNKNAAAIAALIASVVGFTAAVRQAIAAGTNLERQMLALDAVIEATGRSAETSADQLNQLALRLGEDTLGSAVDFRNSLAQLSTFTNIATEDFEELTQVASGMSEIMGGNMVSNIRRLGRLFDDIENNLSSLSRAGINFIEAEEQKLVQLERSGNVAEAHAMILERLAAFSDLATKQSQGFAGQMDTLRERFRAVLEQSSATSSMIGGLTEVMQKVNDAVQNFLENEEAVQRLGNAFRVFAELVSRSLLFLVENASTLAHLFGVVLTGSIIRRLIPAFGAKNGMMQRTMGTMAAYSTAVRTVGASTVAATVATRALTAAARSLLSLLGPIGIAWVVVQGSVNALSGAYDENRTAVESLEKAERILANTKDELVGITDDNIRGLQEEQKERINNMKARLEEIKVEREMVRARKEELEQMQERFEQGPGQMREEDAEELERLQLRYERLNQTVNDAPDLFKDLFDSMRETANESTHLARVTSNLENGIFRMRQEYDSAGLDLAQHQRDIQAVESQYKIFQKEMDDLSDEHLARLSNALGAAGDSVEEVDKAFQEYIENVRNGSDETDDANNALDRMIDRFNALRDEITQTRRALAGDPLGFDMADFRQLEQFDNQQLLQIADQVGVFIRDEANAARELATALRDRENFSNVLDELQQFEQDSRPEADAIREEFQHRRDVINQQITLELDERLNLMRAAHDMQAQQMRELASSMIDLEWEQNEFSQKSALEQINDHFEAQREIIRENFEMEKALRVQMIREINEAEEEEKKRRRQEVVAEQIGQENQAIIKSFADMAEGMKGNTVEAVAGINSALGATTDTLRAVLGEQSSTYKNFATGQAIISGALAVNKTMASVPYPANIAAAALVGAQTGAKIAKIRSQGENFRDGGMIRGPGTSRSDSIPANLSDGEFVMRAEAVRRIGANNLERMNEGNVPNFARGGAVGNVTSAPTINIISEGGNQVEMEEGVGANGEPEITARVKDATRDNMRRGRHDRDMRSNFGVKRQPIRR